MPTAPLAAGPVRRRWIGALGLAVMAIGVVSALLSAVSTAVAQESDDPVYVIEITGVIDLGLAPFLDRALGDAEAAGAAAVVLVIDTPGGRLDAALQMRDALLRSPLRSIAHVDPTAFSAGALIAIAAEEIHMDPGGVMGAATPVDGGTGAPADEKVISAVRSSFRATAEERGRDPQVAEAMVSPNVVVEDLVGRGELLSLTASEAIEWGYADGLAADLPELLEQLELTGNPLVELDLSLAERVVRFITNPVLAGLLLTMGMLLIIGDLSGGGVGLGTAAGATFFGIFFWGHLLAGLSGWEDVLLVGIGVVLILVELLIVPGFGVFGVLGFAGVLGGSFLAMLNRDWEFVGTPQLLRAGMTVGAAFLLVIAGLIVIVRALSRRGGPAALVLQTQLGSGTPVTHRTDRGWMRWFGTGGILDSDSDEGADRLRPVDTRASATEPPPDDAAGEAPAAPADAEPAGAEPQPEPTADGPPTGVALSDLRPAGIAEIDGRRVDVVTEGEYIAQGEGIEVMRDERWRRVVRRARS